MVPIFNELAFTAVTYATFLCVIYVYQLQSQLSESQVDLGKERKLRERAELLCQEFEIELEALQQTRQLGKSTSSLNLEVSQEVSR